MVFKIVVTREPPFLKAVTPHRCHVRVAMPNYAIDQCPLAYETPAARFLAR